MEHLKPTSSFKKEPVQRWLTEIAVVAGILNGILAIAHPRQYPLISTQLVKHERDQPEINTWPFAFGALQIIANRSTLLHRDPSGVQGLYDLLLTVGDYGEQAYMLLASLGVALPYDSGTVVLVDAGNIEHGVPRVSGHRVCLALFSRREALKCWATEENSIKVDADKRPLPIAQPTLQEVMRSSGQARR